jgi:transcriptional regulator with XRE-family HTH domain
MKKNLKSIKEKNTSLSIDIQERANRLRYLRKMSHLSMKEFAQHCNLGLTTINYWEQGYSSVTERGAQKVSKAMREEGIECSVIWLMTGYGEPPKVTDSSKLSKLNYKSLESLSRISINEKKSDYPLENNEIKEELALFRKNYPEHLIYLIDNESIANSYDLYVINSDASLEFPPLRNMKVLSLAPIIRIWKPVKF